MTPARRAAFSPREPYLALPDWVPPSGGLRTWECGDHFDALRIPAQSAPPLIAALQAAGGRGPVLADLYSGSWHILLDPGSGASGQWALNGMRLLRHGTRLTVPAATVTRGPDLHWHTPPGRGDTPAVLLDALLAPPGRTTPPRTAPRPRKSR